MNNYTVRDIYNAIDGFAPFALAEGWDNSGLLVGSMHQPVRSVLVALDITDAVLHEASQLPADLIVAHHPVIFHPLKSLPGESLPYRLAASGIAAICAHTNLDIAKDGVNDALAARLELTGVTPLKISRAVPWRKIVVFVPPAQAQAVTDAMAQAGAGMLGNYQACSFSSDGKGAFLPLDGANPTIGKIGDLQEVREVKVEMVLPAARSAAVIASMHAAHPYEHPAFDLFDNHAIQDSYALGRVGALPLPMLPQDFAAWVKESLGAPGVKYIAGNTPIESVAVCGGAGGDLLADALRAGAQAFVSSEIKHHEWLEAARQGITVVDAGHGVSEQVIVHPLCARLQQLLPECQFHLSQSLCSPVSFL